MLDEKEFNLIFAKNLSNYMLYYGITQLELSKRLNVSTSTVNSWVHAQRTPRMDKVDAICRIFNCNRSDLISEERQLSKYERELIESIQYLNEEGLEKVREYIFDLNLSGRYKKHSIDEAVQGHETA